MTNDSLASWHQLVRTGDMSRLDAILSDDVVFHSPVVHTPQRGRQATARILTAAFHVLLHPSFRYVREVSDGNNSVLEFQVEIDEIAVNGVDMIKWDDDGRIAEFKVMLRPLQAINLIHQKMAQMLGLKQ
jgi:predicted SnoaL-like aldol condensation-catalyzing enzyme